MFARLFVATALLLIVDASSAQPPPPNYVQMPYLGKIDPNTGLLSSFDSGSQHVGIAPFFTEWFYQFSLDADDGQVLGYWIDTSTGYGATIEVQDAGHQNLGPLSGPLPKLSSGNYFLHVTANSPTLFHFGVIARPPVSLYPNDAGHTQDSALPLGTLTSSLSHNNNFYTYFTRLDPPYTNSPATGALIPDFNNPIPYAPSPDWYQFTLSQTAPVKLAVGNIAVPGETYVVVRLDGTSSVWQKNQTQILQPGTYRLMVVDKLTQVITGGGTLGFFRNSHAENFEHYGFQLIWDTNVPAPGGPSSVDLTTTLIDLNTDLGIGGHSTSTSPGGTVTVTCEINNLGFPASSAGNIAYYISKTPGLTPASIFVVHANLFDPVPASGSVKSVTNIMLPSNLAPGQYYLIVVANYDHKVNESNYDNNASNALPVTIVGAAH